MAVAVNLRKGELKKQAVVGFSWTTFFFGFFVPLFRGDWKWFFIMLIAAFILPFISNIIFAFIYNKIYTQNLLEAGYTPADDAERTILKGANLIA